MKINKILNIKIIRNIFPFALFLLLTAILSAISLVNYVNYEKANYSDYAGKMTQMIARQFSVVLSSPAEDKLKLSLIKDISDSVLKTDKNFVCIQYSDKGGKILVSEKSPWYNPENFDGIKVTTAVNSYINSESDTAGYIHTSISKEYNNKKIVSFLKNLICLVIFYIFLCSLICFILRKRLNSEFKIIKCGLKNILEGKFGTKLNYKGSDYTNEVIDLINELSLKLKDYEEKNVDTILLERNKFEAILMGILNGVVVCDNNDCVVLTNASAEKILSASQDVLLNIPIHQYTDSNGFCPFKEKIEEFKDIPLDSILKNPPEYTVNIGDKVIKCVISPMFMQNDEYVGYIMVLTDITRETEVNNMKNQFISNVSHELRTPVTVLRTYLDTLNTMSDELDDETKKEFIATADKEVARLHRMVNDILDVSRLESPDVEVEKEVEDIVPVLQDTISSMQVLANEKSVNIDFEKICDIPQIPFNKSTIERVFNNLLSNAVKYSPENAKIFVKINLTGDFVDISVTDQGPGIEAKHLPKLFDRFYRAENNVHTVKGTGLGLYLVKTTVEKHHGGQVYVNSTVGVGSTFGIKLPVSL